MRYDAMLNVAGEASVLLKAMSNRRRLQILCHLSGGEHSVTALCDLVGLGQSALSQHLAKLRRDGLVQTRRNAQTVYYSVKDDGVARILDTLHQIYCRGGASKRARRPRIAASRAKRPVAQRRRRQKRRRKA